MNASPVPCPECGGTSLFSTLVPSGGIHGPELLPRLGTFLSFARFKVVVCADCGLTRFYADSDARHRVRTARKWQREPPPSC